MLDQSGPTLTQAAALDSVSFLRDPFPVINASDLFNLGTDRNTRVIVFVANLQVAQSPSTEVLITLVDANNQIFDLTAEDVRYVGNLQITQVTFRLPDALSLGVCTVRIKTPLQTSNQGTIRIRNSL